MLEEYQLPNWDTLLRDRSALFVLHTLYLHGARFPPTFETDHAEDYESFMSRMGEAIHSLVTSDLAHSTTTFDLLPADARTAWTLIELLLRSGLFFAESVSLLNRYKRCAVDTLI